MATKIEWCEETWSPITGCDPISSGCKTCYARRMATRLKGRFGYPSDDPFRVTFHPDRLNLPVGWKKPRRIFVCSMSDIGHEDIKGDWFDDIMSIISWCERHTFLLLTKRPGILRERLSEYYPWKNMYVGVTAENQVRADERIPILLKIPAAVRWVSLEPLLSDIDISPYLKPGQQFFDALSTVCAGVLNEPPQKVEYGSPDGIDWAIAGAESGPNRRPCKLEWIESIVEQCKAASVPCFVKQIEVDGRVSHTPEEWPEWARVREWPNGKDMP